MIPVSVCIIAKNEAHHIEECLKRLRPCQFEIILVDTGSDDATSEIALKYTPNVYSFPWCDDFSAARNFSISKASNDWILVIDCDEYLENVNLEKMRLAMEEHPASVGMITRNNPYSLQGIRSVISEQLGRFFNRNFCHFTGKIHEQLLTIENTSPQTFDLPLTLYHEGYVSESEKRLKATRNLEMLLSDLAQKEPDAYTCYQLGQNYLGLNDISKAISWFQKGLSYPLSDSSACIQPMIEAYGYCLLEAGSPEDSLQWIKNYGSYAEHADIAYLTGMIYIKNDLWNEALCALTKATSFPVSSRTGVNSFRAFFQIALVYEKMGDMDTARTFYKKCGEFEPAKKRLAQI